MLVRIPGRVLGKALLLAAHYDSTRDGPGAADDGASVAAILETLRALKSQPALQNDLICIFTDGEEAGLLGAEAFVAEHPWAKEIGLVLNFEYRGNRGPFFMFETSQVIRQTRFAMDCAQRQASYDACWDGLKKTFSGAPR